MREFSKVSPHVWDSERFRSLSDDSAKLAYLYLLSNGHQNSIGCYRLPAGYACDDMGWIAAKYNAAIKALVGAQLLEVDEQTREVFIPRWFKHNPPTNHKHYLGAVRLVEKIESAQLRDRAAADLKDAWERRQGDGRAQAGMPAVSSALLEANRRRSMGSN